MNIVISTVHETPDQKTEEYAKKRVEKLKKFHPKIIKITARLIAETSHREKDDDFTCELDADIPGKNIEISETGQTMMEAIDKAVDKMKILLVKHKEKALEHDRKRN